MTEIHTEEGPPTFATNDGVATIELRRPSQRNNLHDEDLHTLLRHFAQADADASVRVLLLKARTEGQPKPVFCSGYHVGSFGSATYDPLLFEQVPQALERLRPVTVCALGGSVFGGGTDIVLACDLRVGLAGTEFRMPANALGIHYYPSGLRRFVSRLGIGMAQRAFLAARPLRIEQLDPLGLFVQIADAEGFEAAVSSLVQTVAALAPLSAQATKQSLNEIAAGRFDLPTLKARETMALNSADFAEGRAAFMEHRKPRFEGR